MTILFVIIDYCLLYGPQTVVLVVLCGITIFRKELSCNHEFHESVHRTTPKSINNRKNSTRKNSIDDNDISEILDTVGLLGPLCVVCNSVYEMLHSNTKYHSTNNNPPSVLDRLDSDLHSYFHEHSCLSSSIMQLNAKDNNDDDDAKSRSRSFSCKNLFFGALPEDVNVSIFSYIDAQDVVSFSMTCKYAKSLVDDAVDGGGVQMQQKKGRLETSSLVWTALWHRDFANTTNTSWAKPALIRSLNALINKINSNNSQKEDEKVLRTEEKLINLLLCHEQISMKMFYFLFAECWMDYTLAGQVESPCLIGLHGSVVDLTDFVTEHPGSPDILLSEAGKDATKFFESIGHSLFARRRATSLVILDRSSKSSKNKNDNHNIDVIPLKRSTPRAPGTLLKVRIWYERQKESQQIIALSFTDNSNVAALGNNINCYFDPFQGQWRYWYLDMDTCQPLFI